MTAPPTEESRVVESFRPTPFYSDEAIKKAEARRELIRPLVEAGPPYLQRARALSQTTGVPISTIYRYIAKYRDSRDLRSLIRNSRRRAFRLPREVIKLVREVFELRYRDKQRISKSRFALEVRLECKIRQHRVPSYSTVIRHLNLLIKEDGERSVEYSRGNKKRAESLTARQGAFYVARPLDVYEIDHTPLDIIVVDEETRQSILRPFLTVAIDVASRMIAGIYVSLDPVGTNSVGLCLYNAICRKESYLERLGLGDQTWPIYGIPAVIHTDNGKEFVGQGLARFTQMRDIRLEHRPVGAPRFGGHVERVIRTINEEIHNWPGTTHSNVEKRGDYQSEKHAIFTFRELEAKLVNFITGRYHNSIHRALGCSPRKAYADALLADEFSFGIGLPESVDERRLRFDLLPTRFCTVQRDGVTMDGFTYVGEALSAYVGRKNDDGQTERFLIAFDPGHMNEVYLYAHDVDEYYPLRLRDETRPSINIWEAKLMRKRLREQRQDVNEPAIFAALERDRRLTKEAEAKKITARVRRRSEQRKIAAGRRINTSSDVAVSFESDIDWNAIVGPIDGATIL